MTIITRPGQADSSSRPQPKRPPNEVSQPPSAPHHRRSGPPPPSSRVSVAVHVLPFGQHNKDNGHVMRVLDEACLVFDPTAQAEQRACGGLARASKIQKLFFDKVFYESTDNMYIYEHTTKKILKTSPDGCNCSVLAYGAAGAGKTFTLLGYENCQGVIFLTVSELCKRVDDLPSEDQKCDVAVIAYFEVRREVVRNFLRPSVSRLVVKDNLVLPNLATHGLEQVDFLLLELLLRGNRNRTEHATDPNAESSQFHATFEDYVSETENATGLLKNVRASKMSFADLAELERAAAFCRNNRARLHESTKINLSLRDLGNRIDALSKNKTHHVPYSNCKVTRILKGSLGKLDACIVEKNLSPSRFEVHNAVGSAGRSKTSQSRRSLDAERKSPARAQGLNPTSRAPAVDNARCPSIDDSEEVAGVQPVRAL
ncbi:kinesin-like protein KIF18B [Haemaphysalis longicornis]